MIQLAILLFGLLILIGLGLLLGWSLVTRMVMLLLVGVLSGSLALRLGFNRGGFGGAMVVGLTGAALGGYLATVFGLPMLIGAGVFGLRFDVLWSSIGIVALATLLRSPG